MLTTYFVLILAIFIGGIVGAVLIFQAKKNIHFLYLRNFTFNKRSTEFIEKYFLEYSNLNFYLIPIFSERYVFHYFKLFKFFKCIFFWCRVHWILRLKILF